MRLHRNLTFAVIDSIRDIFNEGVYADKAVEKALKRDKRWGSRDRKFVAETIYEIVWYFSTLVSICCCVLKLWFF